MTKHPPKDKKQQANIWDFLINFTNRSYNLFHTGNIIGGTFFAFCILMMFRYPSEKLPILIDRVIEFFFRAKYYHPAAFGLTGVYILHATGTNKKTYKKEIKRLEGEKRKLLSEIEQLKKQIGQDKQK